MTHDPIQHLRELLAKASLPPNEATAELIRALPALLDGVDKARADLAACRAELAAERELTVTLRDAYETLYDSIKEMPDESDADAAIYRCLRRRFEEAVGCRFTRLLKERPEGQKLYALAEREKKS